MFTSVIKKAAFLLFVLSGLWQTAGAQPGQIDQYIQEALANNQGLRQRSLNIDKSMAALKEARSYYLPNISFGTNYYLAGGGRTIDLPIGDLMNPVYSTLNQLTASNRFPQIENESVLLNPNNFYDAKIHTTLPLINREIVWNQRIRKENISREQAAVNVYKRELIKDIKTAYYHYYQAGQAVQIYENTLLLVKENIRVNESLLRNGATNATALTRAQTEQQKIEAALAEAKNKEKNAKAYFNFLLNRELVTAITIDSGLFKENDAALSQASPREELQQINALQNIQEFNAGLQKSAAVPKLSTFLDLGAQDFNFRLNNKSFYYFFGLSLQWDIFSGGKTRSKIQQADYEVQAAQALFEETSAAISLQEEQSRNNLATALGNHTNALKQVAFAEKYYSDQFKVYKEGRLLYIELVDAQNQLTAARLQQALAEGDILIARAELERNLATYILP